MGRCGICFWGLEGLGLAYDFKGGRDFCFAGCGCGCINAVDEAGMIVCMYGTGWLG